MTIEVPKNFNEINRREEVLKNDIENFKTLINEKFKGEEKEKINKALELMLELHLNQKDRSDGNPYAKHPLEVAEKVIEVADDIKSDLVISALLHDSVEDKADMLFAKRANRKFNGNEYNLIITEETKDKYKDIFKDWAFKEIREEFGEKIEYYIKNLTNHDFDSLAEDMNLIGDDKVEFKNQAYAHHVEEIIEDPDICLLKYGDFSKNMDLSSLPKENSKYDKLKRKYKSVIPIFINRLKEISENHQLFLKKDMLIDDLQRTYNTQYAI